MPTKRFALSKGQPKNLEVSWGRDGKVVGVQFAGSPLPRAAGMAGYFSLPDGSDVSVEILGDKVVAIRNGEFLPGTAFDPLHKVRAAAVTLTALAALHLAAGWLPVTKSFPFPQDLPLLVPTFFLGALYSLLAWAAWHRSKLAMAVGLAVTLLEGFLFALGYLFAGYFFRRPLLCLLPALLLYEGLEGVQEVRAAEQPVGPR